LGADLSNPDFVALAESFGVMGLKATNQDELRQALETAIATDAPVVIEVPVPTGSDTSPWPFIHPAPPTA
jgi:acetolactate synthase-1/2/3 large subunit